MNISSSYFSAQNLYKVWDSVTVDFSMKASEGTMTAILGPSGSGKSTILRIIAGLEKCTPRTDKSASPSIQLGGKDITRTAPALRGIGMVFQNHALFTHLRIDDNVAYGLRCAGMGKTESRRCAQKYLEQFGLSGFGQRYPETLSGGEAQRVSLARTLIIHPRLVLFDEPLSALDTPLRRKLAEDIRQLQKKTGFTGILVTHSLEEAVTMADTMIFIEKGVIRWEGKPSLFSENMITGC
jgi:thiamine transport system ATP-binding protein